MTGLSIVALTVAVWGQRLLGAFVVGPLLAKRPAVARAMGLIPAAVVMAVIVQLSVATGRTLVVDARLAGVAGAPGLGWGGAAFLRGGVGRLLYTTCAFHEKGRGGVRGVSFPITKTYVYLSLTSGPPF